MSTTAKDLVLAVAEHGVSPSLAAAVVERSLTGDQVSAFVVLPQVGPDGLDTGVVAAAIAGPVWHYWWWGTPRPGPTPAVQSLVAEIDRLEALLHDDPDTVPDPGEPVVPVFARSAPLSSVVDVRTDMALAADGSLRSIEVTAACPLPDLLSLHAEDCGDPDCEGDHGLTGWVTNETVRLALEAPAATAAAMESLARFAALLARAGK